MINKLQNKITEYLTYLIHQINKDGITSELSIYMYNDFYKKYIVDVKYRKYPMVSNSFEDSKDWSNIWYRSIVLFVLNFGKQKYEKYRFKKMLKLSGGFGTNSTMVVGNKNNSLSEFDNMNMDKI